MKWVKWDPDAWLAGTIGLTPEERGIYDTIINLLYSRDGDVANDDRFMARACNCRPQEWRRIRDRLIAKDKVRVLHGNITANRVETTLKTAQKLIENMAHLGRVSAQKRKYINGGMPTGRSNAPLVKTKARIESSLPSSSEPNPAREASAEPPQAGGRDSKPGQIPITPALQARIDQWKREGKLR